MGDIVSAMNDYQEAVKVDPQYTLAHFNVGNILFQQRHFRQVGKNCKTRMLCFDIIPIMYICTYTIYIGSRQLYKSTNRHRQ